MREAITISLFTYIYTHVAKQDTRKHQICVYFNNGKTLQHQARRYIHTSLVRSALGTLSLSLQLSPAELPTLGQGSLRDIKPMSFLNGVRCLRSQMAPLLGSYWWPLVSFGRLGWVGGWLGWAGVLDETPKNQSPPNLTCKPNAAH